MKVRTGDTEEEEAMMSQVTWYFQVEVTGAADGGDGGRLALPGDALLHPPLAQHLHGERTSCRDSSHFARQSKFSCRENKQFQTESERKYSNEEKSEQ